MRDYHIQGSRNEYHRNFVVNFIDVFYRSNLLDVHVGLIFELEVNYFEATGDEEAGYRELLLDQSNNQLLQVRERAIKDQSLDR